MAEAKHSSMDASNTFEQDWSANKILAVHKWLNEQSIDAEKLPTMTEFYKKYGETRMSLKIQGKFSKSKLKGYHPNIFKLYDKTNGNECHILQIFEVTAYRSVDKITATIRIGTYDRKFQSHVSI